jgi:hypothetical protein
MALTLKDQLDAIIKDIASDGRLGSSALSAHIGYSQEKVDRFIYQNILAVSSGQALHSSNGQYQLTLSQALTVRAHLIPRRVDVEIALRLGFISKQVTNADYSPKILNVFAQNLGDFATTPLGLIALETAAKKIIDST